MSLSLREWLKGDQVADARPPAFGGLDERSIPLPAAEVSTAVDVQCLTRDRRGGGQE